jgi:hypothetical protein
MGQQQKDREVITILVNILKGNPYSEVLKTMGQLEDADEYRISLNLDPQEDQRTYNLQWLQRSWRYGSRVKVY